MKPTNAVLTVTLVLIVGLGFLCYLAPEFRPEFGAVLTAAVGYWLLKGKTSGPSDDGS